MHNNEYLISFLSKTMSGKDNHIVCNPHLSSREDDFMYHFGFGKCTDDLPSLFGDVKFVCCGGTKSRMERLAAYIREQLGQEAGAHLKDLSKSERFSIFKAGPVLCINHGIGTASLSVMLAEVFKILHYAKCENVTFFRVGTSGGVGLDPGTVVVASGAVNGALQPYHTQIVLGKFMKRKSPLDVDLSTALLSLKDEFDFPVATGLTMCCDDFYEGQGRLDGAFCDYEECEKMEFLQKIRDFGVRNLEMESTCFASMCHRANCKSAIVCVTLINRLNGDQMSTPKETLKRWELRPIQLVTRYIQNVHKK